MNINGVTVNRRGVNITPCAISKNNKERYIGFLDIRYIPSQKSTLSFSYQGLGLILESIKCLSAPNEKIRKSITNITLNTIARYEIFCGDIKKITTCAKQQ